MIPTSNAKVVVIRAKRAPRKCALNALLTATMISSQRKIDPPNRTCGCMLFTKVSCVTLRRLSSMRASPKTTEITIADAESMIGAGNPALQLKEGFVMALLISLLLICKLLALR